MEKSGAKFKIFGHSTEIIWQSKIKGPLNGTPKGVNKVKTPCDIWRPK